MSNQHNEPLFASDVPSPDAVVVDEKGATLYYIEFKTAGRLTELDKRSQLSLYALGIEQMKKEK